MEKFGECRDGSNPGQFLMVSTEFESVPRTHNAQIAYIMHMPSYNTYVYIYICTSSTAQGGGGRFKNRKPIGEIGCCESLMAERSH